jgi:hypothetical protein
MKREDRKALAARIAELSVRIGHAQMMGYSKKVAALRLRRERAERKLAKVK